VAGEDVVYGLWIFAEEGASTEKAREDNAMEIARCAQLAEESGKIALLRVANVQEENRQLDMGGGDGYAAEQEESEVEPAGSVPMGRQVSLRELFGKQREQDAGFAVKHHESPKFQDVQPVLPTIQQRVETQQPPTAAAPQEKAPTPMFFSNPDTDFFRSGPRFTPQQNETPTPAAPAPAPPSLEGENPLLALLRGNG